MSLNKFNIKIYSITNLIILLILTHDRVLAFSYILLVKVESA